MPLSVVVQIAVSGALMGLVYALIAYGFQLTYATSKSLNFAQGELVMVSAFVSLTLLNTGLPYVVMVPLGILFGALLGVVVERVAVRLALQQKSEGWILLTIIASLFLVSFAENDTRNRLAMMVFRIQPSLFCCSASRTATRSTTTPSSAPNRIPSGTITTYGRPVLSSVRLTNADTITSSPCAKLRLLLVA